MHALLNVSFRMTFSDSEILNDTKRCAKSLRQLSFLFDTFDAPVRGLRLNTVITFGVEKLEWCGYR